MLIFLQRIHDPGHEAFEMFSTGRVGLDVDLSCSRVRANLTSAGC